MTAPSKSWSAARPRQSLAALKTKLVAASLSATQTGFLLEERGEGRLLADCSQAMSGPFELFTTFASNSSR